MFYAGWKLWNFCRGSSVQRDQKEVQDVQVKDEERTVWPERSGNVFLTGTASLQDVPKQRQRLEASSSGESDVITTFPEVKTSL